GRPSRTAAPAPSTEKGGRGRRSRSSLCPATAACPPTRTANWATDPPATPCPPARLAKPPRHARGTTPPTPTPQQARGAQRTEAAPSLGCTPPATSAWDSPWRPHPAALPPPPQACSPHASWEVAVAQGCLGQDPRPQGRGGVGAGVLGVPHATIMSGTADTFILAWSLA